MWWPGPAVFSPQISQETFAVVNVPGTANAIVNNDRNVTTNTQGQVLVPYLSAYRKNALILDASQAPEDAAELLGNVQDIVPYARAVTLVNFRTDTPAGILSACRAPGRQTAAVRYRSH